MVAGGWDAPGDHLNPVSLQSARQLLGQSLAEAPAQKSAYQVFPPFLADLAMRGCAISLVMRASIALSDSVPVFFMLLMFTFLIARGSSSASSPEHHHRSGEGACLLHYAHLTVPS